MDTALLRQIAANLTNHIRQDWVDEITAAADMIDSQQAALERALPILNMGFNAEGDVYGRDHNEATDVCSLIETLIQQ